jgi:hypothetical protein
VVWSVARTREKSPSAGGRRWLTVAFSTAKACAVPARVRVTELF